MAERTRPAQPKPVDREVVKLFIANVLGFDPDVVTKVKVTPDAVFVTELLLNPDGRKYVIGASDDPALYPRDCQVPNIGKVAKRVVKVHLRKLTPKKAWVDDRKPEVGDTVEVIEGRHQYGVTHDLVGEEGTVTRIVDKGAVGALECLEVKIPGTKGDPEGEWYLDYDDVKVVRRG